MIRKFNLPNSNEAAQFAATVIEQGGDAYQWYQTATVVVKGEIPEGHHVHEAYDVTDLDALMLTIGWG